MVEFIYGEPVSGKTTLIYDKIRSDLSNGEKVILIVPDQEALEAEAAVIKHCRGISTLDLNVYGFSRLCNEVFRKYGGISYNYADKTGQTLAVFLALTSVSPALQIYGGVPSSDASLLSSVLYELKEIKRQGLTAEQIGTACDSVSSVSLKKKMHDIALIMPAYNSVLSSAGDDPDSEEGRMYRILSERGGLPDHNIYIDSFYGFTGIQFKLLKLFMMTSKKVTVSLALPGPSGRESRYDVLSPVYETDRRLRAYALSSGEIRDTVFDNRYVCGQLQALGSVLRGNVYGQTESNGRIKIFCAGTKFEEADMIASDVRRKLMSGCRCRDIAVICGNTDAWRGIIDASLEKFGVPYFLSNRTDARQKALFRLVLSALYICENDFRAKDISSYIKSGLLGCDPDGLDLFDDYIKRRNIRGLKVFSEDFEGSPDGYGIPFDDSAVKRLETVNRVRAAVITPLSDLHHELKECVYASDISKALVRLLQRIGITETLQKMKEEAYAEGDAAEAEEISQLWSVFVSCTTQLCTVCKDLPMDIRRYRQLLDTVLTQTDIGKIPTSVDEVTVADAGSVRLHGIKHVYLIGCNEGEFPVSGASRGIFDPDEREELLLSGIELGNTAEKENEKNVYDFYRAVSSASESVTFSYSASASDGKESYPCHVLNDVKAAFEDVTVKSGINAADAAGSVESAIEYAAYHAGSAESSALFRIISEDEDGKDKLAVLSTPLSTYEDSIDESVMKQLIPGNVRISPTRLNTFNDCSMKHCFRYFLNLSSSENIEFGVPEFGTFAHYILKRMIDDCIKDEAKLNSSEKELERMLSIYINDYCRDLLHIDPAADGMGRLRAQLKRLKKSMVKASEDILDELRTGKFKPAATELTISENNGIPPLSLELPNGKKTYLTGQIDRVDTYEKDGVTYIKLVDYKSSDVKFSLSDISDGKNIQLFMYMLTVCSQDKVYTNPVPAALYYMEITPHNQTSNSSGDEPDTASLYRGGIASASPDVLEALESGLDKKGGRIFKAGKTSSTKIVFTESEEMKAVFEEVRSTVIQTAENICSGKVKVTEDSSGDACKNCPYMPVCRSAEKKGER